MTFLNPLLLFAALGVSLPILAHLLNQVQVRHTDWAAMRFLDRTVRVRSRQLRLRDLLLLVLRCAALLLLVLALARPAWTGRWEGTAALPGEPRAGVVIAVDASFSMGEGAAESTRFRRALAMVDVIAGRILPGDPVSLVLLGDEHRVVLRTMAYDDGRFRAAVEGLRPGPGMLDLDGVPELLTGLAADMKAPQKEIYLITDTQARDWRQPSDQLRESLAALGSSATVFLVPVPGAPANLAVTELALVSGVLRKGTTARYQATVRNFGPEPAANVEVRCRVDDVQIDAKTIPLVAAGAAETVSLFVPFHNAGPTRITAEITGDLVAADDVRRTVAVVRDRVSVLCVDGSSGDAGRLVAAALLARGDDGDDEDYAVRTVPWLSLPAEDLGQVDVLVMAGVPEIMPEQADQLARFVRRGNGLVWFAGDEVKQSTWNERASSLLPAKLGRPVDVGDALGAGRPLDPGVPDHPVCRPLASLPEDLLSETRFLRVLEAEPRPSSSVVLRLAGGGGPVLLEHALGRGHVFLFTTTADRSWNNMGLTPAFPLLLQQIVTYLAGREFEQPHLVGDSLALTYVEQPDASDAVFDTPAGETVTVPVIDHQGQYVALLDRADEAGFYTARVSVQSPGMPIAVNVDPRESEVACLGAAELQDMAGGLGLEVVATDAELAAAIDSARTGRSAWRTFMIAALGLLVGESLFADGLLRRRRAGANPSTPAGQHA
jgi:hypothetical protein